MPNLKHEISVHGFHAVDTGGNCKALRREFPLDGCALITLAGEPKLPTTWTDRVSVSYHQREESSGRVWNQENVGNVIDALEWLANLVCFDCGGVYAPDDPPTQQRFGKTDHCRHCEYHNS